MVGDVPPDVPPLVVATDFAERGGLTDLRSNVAQVPEAVGIGIDDDTVAVLTGSRFEVVGSGTVTVVDAAGAHIHVLPAGYGFELTTRSPVVG